MEQRCVLEVIEIVLSQLLAIDEVFLGSGRGCQKPHQNVKNKEESYLNPKDQVPIVLLDPLIVGVFDTALEHIVVKPRAA